MNQEAKIMSPEESEAWLSTELQERHDAIMDKLDTIYERMATERRAIGFISDHIKDPQAMSYLNVFAYGQRMTENLLLEVMGRPVDETGMDVPY